MITPPEAPSSLDDLVYALHCALQHDEAMRRPYEAALSQWEGCAGFASALFHLYASPPPQLAQPERLLAVLCLKNAVARRWHSHREDESAIADGEKEIIRTGLLVAVQVLCSLATHCLLKLCPCSSPQAVALHVFPCCAPAPLLGLRPL